MPIRYYEGIEGSGKTAMMTRDLLQHHIAGGKVLVFPGYELRDGKGNAISEVILPEQWVTLPDSLKRKKVAIGIDEVTNFFNNHVWYNKICDMMAGLMAERRKFEIAILMTGPVFNRLPPNMKELIHEIIHCKDSHTNSRKFPRGEICVYYKEDLRGLLSLKFPKHRFTKRRGFKTKPYWDYYDTYQAVDLINQFIKVKFKSREIIVGADGKVWNREGSEESQHNMKESINELVMLSEKAKSLKQQGITQLTPYELARELGQPLTKKLKDVLKPWGIYYDKYIQGYRIENHG